MLPPRESPDAGSSLPISANASALPWDSDPVLRSGTPDGRGAASLKIVSRVPGKFRDGELGWLASTCCNASARPPYQVPAVEKIPSGIVRHVVERGGAEEARGAQPRPLRRVHERVVQGIRHGDRHPAHGEREGREDVELVCRNERHGLDRDALRRRGPGDGPEHHGERDDAARHATPRSVGMLRYTRYPSY